MDDTFNERVISHDKFLGDESAHDPSLIPTNFMWGSFGGILRDSDQSIQQWSEFGLIFHGKQVVGHGFDSAGEFFLVGKMLVIAGDATPHPEMKLALSLTRPQVQLDRNEKEIRLEFTQHILAANRPYTSGFIGTVYHQDDNGLVTSGDISIWPTPFDERNGGFYAIKIEMPVCGLEHTGTFSHWHGTGAEIRVAHDPCKSLGVEEGDVLKMVNGKLIPHRLKSQDISVMLRTTPRPMTLYFWREIKRKARRLTTTSLDDTLSSNWSVESPPAESSSPPAERSELHIDSSRSEFQEMKNRSEELKIKMMGELLKKKKSLSDIRQSRQDRKSILTAS
jgi:hypothetical protein